MFTLKKIITPFLLPPGLFILIAVAGMSGSLVRRNFRAAWVCFWLSLLIWVFSISPTRDIILGGLENGLTIPSAPQGDVIIMLGGGLYPNTPDFSGTSAPGFGTMERMVTAARLHRRLGLPIIVSGGRVDTSGVAIAPIVKRFLMDLGVAPDRIIIEDRSRDTYENALFSKERCEQFGFKHPLLVTTGFHMKRALFCFKSVGLNATPYPCGLTVWREKQFQWKQLLPSANTLQATSAGIHEWLGRLFYLLRYHLP